MVISAGGGSDGWSARRRGSRTRVRPTGVLAFVGLVLVGFFGARAVLGLGPRGVSLVYVREENSLGLTALPAPEMDVQGFAAGDGRVRLPGGADGPPRGTRMVVVRETYAAGVLVEAQVIYLNRFPGLVRGRDPEGSGVSRLDPACTLLATDLTLEAVRLPDRRGWGVRVDVPDPAAAGLATGDGPGGGVVGDPGPDLGATLGPGEEWRLAAVWEEGRACLLRPGSPDYATRIRQAFRENRAVSVLSVTAYGVWDTRALEVTSGIPTGES